MITTDAVRFLTQVAAYTAILTLVVAGISHIARPTHLREALGQQRIVPKGQIGLASMVLPVLEIGLGIAGGATILSGRYGLQRGTFLSISALYATFAIYSYALMRLRSGVPCGCASQPVPVSGWVVFRASLLGIAAAGAALQSEAVFGSPPPLSVHTWVAVLASLGLVVLLWILPVAMSSPLALPARGVLGEGSNEL